jgi:hypothetical protein
MARQRADRASLSGGHRVYHLERRLWRLRKYEPAEIKGNIVILWRSDPTVGKTGHPKKVGMVIYVLARQRIYV